jgi:putative DNA primase/helicase
VLELGVRMVILPTEQQQDITWDDLPLAERHRDELIGSAISPAVAAERGYRTVTTIRDVKKLGFAESQCLMPGLLLPSYNVAGEIAGYQYKPDVPRIKDGKPNKYESPPKSISQLDVPPRARP